MLFVAVWSPVTTGNVNMVAWKPEVHFRKSAKSRMHDSKSPDYKRQATDSFIDYFHIFMGTWRESTVGIVSWCESSPEMHYGSPVCYKKWTEIYGPKMWLAQKCSTFIKNIEVLISCSCFVYAGYAEILTWTSTRESKMAPKTGNSNRPSIRNKMFAKFQRLYLYLGGGAIYISWRTFDTAWIRSMSKIKYAIQNPAKTIYRKW